MSTEVIPVDAQAPDPAALARAAAVLRAGGLVAFPTETVYGLGANALDAAAVARVFAAKGRPARNPVIVHVATAKQARDLATEWPTAAGRLTARFWPGPLTLVLRKRAVVPDAVTAGGPTVAVRLPAHPVALGLLQAAALPVAAPSANRSTALSPTRAEHVLRGLGGRIDLLLDGGPTPGGIESTVVDVTVDPPRLLRPGLVSLAELEALLGPVERPAQAADEVLRSPGLLSRHYAPGVPLLLLPEPEARARVTALCHQGRPVGWVTFDPADHPGGAQVVALPCEPAGYATGLYAALHQLDTAGLEEIVVTEPPATPDWQAVLDRLRRAAHP